MITSVDALISVLKENQASHWKLFRDYNRNDPSPIAESVKMVGDDPDLDASLAALRRVFDTLGSGKYHVRYNNVNTFNRGYMSTDVMVSNAGSGINPQQGIAGIAGYVTPDQLADKLALQQKEFEIRQLQEQINAIREDKNNGGMIGSIMKVLNGNPELSKAVANVISGIAGKVMPDPQIHNRAAVGTVGFTDKKDHPGSDGPDDQLSLPDHMDKLSDDDFMQMQTEMQNACMELWVIDPDFPSLLPKLVALAKNKPEQYTMAKAFLK